MIDVFEQFEILFSNIIRKTQFILGMHWLYTECQMVLAKCRYELWFVRNVITGDPTDYFIALILETKCNIMINPIWNFFSAAHCSFIIHRIVVFSIFCWGIFVSIWYISMQKTRVWNNKKINGHTHTSVLTCWIINANLGQQMTTRPMSLFIFCWCHLPQKSLVLTIQFASV